MAIFLTVGVLKKCLRAGVLYTSYLPRSADNLGLMESLVSGVPIASNSVSIKSGGTVPLNIGAK